MTTMLNLELGQHSLPLMQMLINKLDGLHSIENEKCLLTLEEVIISFKHTLEEMKSTEKDLIHSMKEKLRDKRRLTRDGPWIESQEMTPKILVPLLIENGEIASNVIEPSGDILQRLKFLQETELDRARAINENLSSQLKDTEQLNQDLVIPEIEKLHFEFSSIKQDASYSEKEVEQTEKVLLVLQNEKSFIHADLDEVQQLLLEKTNEWNSICHGPTVARENADHIQKEMELHQDELCTLKERNFNTEESITETVLLISEDTDRISSLSQALEKINAANEEKEESLKKLQRQLDASKLNRGKIVTSRLQLELDLKNVQDKVKSTKRGEILWKKQAEDLSRMLERKHIALDSDTRIISHLVAKIDECERTIRVQKTCNESIAKEVDNIKASMSNKVRRLSHQNNCRDDLNIRLEKALRSLGDIETELNATSIENDKLDKLLSLLSAHTDILVTKAAALNENEDEAKEQFKMKNLVVIDLKSTLHECSKRLVAISILYATLMNEKEIITAARVASSEKIVGIENHMVGEKLHLEALLNDYEQKSCILLKHQDSYENSRFLRATFQTEKADVSILLREKKEESNRWQLQIKNLRVTLTTLQREISMEQSRKRSLVGANRILSKKLIETMNEINRSHQRTRLQERYIKESDVSIRQRHDDIRLISLKVLFLSLVEFVLKLSIEANYLHI